MIPVPTTPGRAVQVQSLDSAPLRYTPARNLVGDAVEQLGAAIGGAAAGLDDIALRRAEYAAKEGSVAFAAEADAKLYDPDEGLFSKQGKDAVDAYEGVLRDLDTVANDLLAKQQDPRGRDALADNLSARKYELRRQIGSFVVGQRQVYEDGTDQALKEAELADAGRAWADDERSEVHLATAAQITARMANRQGRGLAWAQEKALTDESGARRDIAIARINNVGPDAGQEYFDKFSGVFTPDDARVVQSGIRVRREAIAAEERRVAAEERARVAAAKAQERERLETLRVQLETGAGSSADWVALADGYSAIGDTSGAASARAKAGETRAAEAYRDKPLAVIDRDIAVLEAKQGKLSPDQASRLNGLQSLRGQVSARLNQPGGAMLQEQHATGKVIAPLDLKDHATFRSRGLAAVAAAQRQGGRVEPLFADDIRNLQKQMDSGATGRLEVLNTIALFHDPRAIEGAAKQLSGDSDGDFRIAATLRSSPAGERVALEILRGADALATSPKSFNLQSAQFEFNRSAAPALAGMPPEYSRDVFSAAKSIYAERARQKGQTGWDPELWRGAVNSALGGEQRSGRQHGGLVRRGDKWVSIPPGWTGEQLFSRIATMDGAASGKAAITDAPVWPDGSRVTIGQIRTLTPVRLGGTRYGFQTRAGRLLGTKSGRPYTIDVSKLPRARK